MTTVRIFVTDDAPSTSPLPDTVVRIFSTDGVTFVTQGETDTNGEALFELPEELYWVRLFKSGYRFPSRLSIEVLVDEDNAFEAQGTDLVTRVPSTDVNLCRVSGRIVNGSGAPASGATIYFTSTGAPRVVGTSVWVPSKVYAHSDSEGVMSLDLVRNTVYEAWVSGHDDVTYRVRIPDHPSADLGDLLFPYVARVVVPETSVTIARRETVTQVLDVMLSSRITVPYALDGKDIVQLSDVLTVTPDDATIVTTSLLREGTLRITGLAVGTTVVRFSPLPTEVLSRQPPALGDFDTVTVTVTE